MEDYHYEQTLNVDSYFESTGITIGFECWSFGVSKFQPLSNRSLINEQNEEPQHRQSKILENKITRWLHHEVVLRLDLIQSFPTKLRLSGRVQNSRFRAESKFSRSIVCMHRF